MTAAQMAEVDRVATQDMTIPAEVLMEAAALQIARAARAMLGGSVAGKRIVGLIGGGNNGGDTTAALRRLANWGALVTAELAAPDRTVGLAGLEVTRLLMATNDAHVAVVHDATVRGPLTLECDLLLDGLLGYSARGAPRDHLPELIRAANASGSPILAVDLPSGLDPDSGEAPGAIVGATATVTLALPKTGLAARRADCATGTLLLADIGIPHAAFARASIDTRGLFGEGDLVRVLR